MSIEEVGKVAFMSERDGWDLAVKVRVVSDFEGDTWPDRTAGETLVEIRATGTGALDAKADIHKADETVMALRAELAAQLETVEGIGEMGGESTPPVVHDAESISYVDIVLRAAAGGAGAAAGKVLFETAAAKVRDVLKSRRETSGEAWREEQGYL